jgi:hypothetical protein
VLFIFLHLTVVVVVIDEKTKFVTCLVEDELNYLLANSRSMKDVKVNSFVESFKIFLFRLNKFLKSF